MVSSTPKTPPATSTGLSNLRHDRFMANPSPHSTVAPEITRRSFGALGLAALTMPAAISAASANGVRRADDLFPTDAELVRALIKMRSSTDSSLRFGWLEANRVAYIEGEIFPLLTLLAGSVSRAKDNGDGTFDVTVMEVTYYLDTQSGELLDTLKLPVTGMDVKVPLYRSQPTATRVSVLSRISEISTGDAGVVRKDDTDGDAAFAPKGDVQLDRSVGPVYADGDDVWIETSEYGRVSPANPGDQPVFYKESAIWLGTAKELLDTEVHSAQTKLSYSAASSWRPWMQMGDVKGHTMAHGIGGKCDALDGMPEKWLQLTETYHPEIMTDPGAVLREES